MSTSEVKGIPLAQNTAQEQAAANATSAETLERLRADVYTETLAHCVYKFFGVGFYFPFVAVPVAWLAYTLRYGLPTYVVAELFVGLLVSLFYAALAGMFLALVATCFGSIIALPLVHFANRSFRFPFSVVASSAAISSLTVFLLLIPYVLVAGWIRTPEFWLIGVGLGTFLCQWMVTKTVRHELPKVIDVRARKASVQPELLAKFVSSSNGWQFELRDMFQATVWLAVLFALLRALRLAEVHLEMYVILSALFHVPMCWLMSRWHAVSE